MVGAQVIVALATAIAAVAAGLLIRRYRRAYLVQAWQSGLFYRDGVFQRRLDPGRHVLWGDAGRIAIHPIPANLQVHATGAVDVTSADRFAYRLAANLTYTIVDPRHAFEQRFGERLRLAAADAVARLAQENTLEAMLTGHGALTGALVERVSPAVPDLKLETAFIGPLQLPPDARRLFTEVERARMEAQAALERARGEQASLRSLANAARLVKGNPELMHLRLLQAASSRGATLVIGQNALGLDGASGKAPEQAS